ncbi:SGNH/GDSL hydrolase family protein [Nocardioides mesophilus]|uniref:SGNH/GDSL hydrolase family protein n=1 Tax=Nocardioides mesophilus TaxID=433659 RepID=A0A7G9R8R0_9ACTN|nr:SGNH/GDSL hydrolase family protein [Nocardioides mesophilus]QNN51985.1 SGNH/GDSL hydrolase family protein [Nocardioides mesophilus]
MTMRLALLGDSIAHGQGASRPGDALAPRLTSALAQRGFEVTSRVFAVRGARSADLARQLPAALGWRPQVALVVIGANDLTHRVAPDLAARALGEAVRRLRELEAEVVVAPAPDLSLVPHVPPELRDLAAAGSRLFRGLQVEAVHSAGGRVADLHGETAAGFAADLALFSGDRFHPSSAGYAVIADALLPELVEAFARVRDRRPD